MKSEGILVSFTGAAVHVAGEDLLAHFQLYCGADGRTINLARALKLYGEPFICVAAIAPKLATAGQVQVTILVKVTPRGLIGLGGTNARWAGGIVKFPIPAIAIEHTGVAGIDGGEKEVEVSVIIVIGKGRAGVGFLPV